MEYGTYGTQDVRSRERIFNVIADTLYGLSLASVVGSAVLMMRGVGTRDHEKESRCQRWALFVGQWAPTLAIMGRIFASQTRQPELPFAPQHEEKESGIYGGRLAESR